MKNQYIDDIQKYLSFHPGRVHPKGGSPSFPFKFQTPIDAVLSFNIPDDISLVPFEWTRCHWSRRHIQVFSGTLFPTGILWTIIVLKTGNIRITFDGTHSWKINSTINGMKCESRNGRPWQEGVDLVGGVTRENVSLPTSIRAIECARDSWSRLRETTWPSHEMGGENSRPQLISFHARPSWGFNYPRARGEAKRGRPPKAAQEPNGLFDQWMELWEKVADNRRPMRKIAAEIPLRFSPMPANVWYVEPKIRKVFLPKPKAKQMNLNIGEQVLDR